MASHNMAFNSIFIEKKTMIKHLKINNNGTSLAERDNYVYTYFENLQKEIG